MSETRQKGHGKKRPRRFHRGRAEGKRSLPALDRIEQAEQRGVVLDEAARCASQRLLADVDLWADFACAAPFVPTFEVRL